MDDRLAPPAPRRLVDSEPDDDLAGAGLFRGLAVDAACDGELLAAAARRGGEGRERGPGGSVGAVFNADGGGDGVEAEAVELGLEAVDRGDTVVQAGAVGGAGVGDLGL